MRTPSLLLRQGKISTDSTTENADGNTFTMNNEGELLSESNPAGFCIGDGIPSLSYSTMHTRRLDLVIRMAA